MSVPLPLLLPVFALLAGDAIATPPGPGLWEPGVRHIELAEASQVHEVGISPGLTTAFRFHGAAINWAEAALAGRERFWMVTAEDAILLVPSEVATIQGSPEALLENSRHGRTGCSACAGNECSPSPE